MMCCDALRMSPNGCDLESPRIRRGLVMDVTKHFNQEQLAERWNISPRTLQRWRLCLKGPVFCRIGHSVRYRMEDILAFEAQRRITTQQEGLSG